MPGSPSALEKEEARRAVTAGLTDGTTARTLQDAGDSSKKKREQIKAERERREREEQKEKEVANNKCLSSPISQSLPPIDFTFRATAWLMQYLGPPPSIARSCTRGLEISRVEFTE